MSEKTRIGLVLCTCGGKFNDKLDFASLKEAIAKEFPDLCLIESPDYGHLSAEVTEQLTQAGVTRVIIATCARPFLKEEHAQDYYWVNLHIQGSKDDVTQQAREKLLAAIRRAPYLQPAQWEEVTVAQKVLVIGAGLAGLATAEHLAQAGLQVTLVEQNEEPGGLLADLRVYQEGQWQDILGPYRERVTQNERIALWTKSEVLRIKGDLGNFAVRINKSGEQKVEEIYGAIVWATGMRLEYPQEVYGVALGQRVMTQYGLESTLARGELPKVLTQESQGPRRVVFLTGMLAEGYKLSVISALKTAVYLHEHSKDIRTYIVVKDVKVAGAELDALYRQAREKGALIYKLQDTPPLIEQHDDKLDVLIMDEIIGSLVKIPCDLLVAEERYRPSLDPSIFRYYLNLTTQPLGFLQRDNVHLLPVETGKKGIYAVGTCRLPSTVPEVLADAASAAGAITTLLANGKLKVPAGRLEVEKGKCTLCLTCQRFCPHDAITYRRAPIFSLVSCQACGICASECPNKAITIRSWSDELLWADVTS